MRDKERIEQELGMPLEWQELPEKTASRIAIYNPANATDESVWPSQHKWLKDTIEAFDRVFRQRVKNLNPEEWNGSEAA